LNLPDNLSYHYLKQSNCIHFRWTFEVAGLNISKFQNTGAAFIHQNADGTSSQMLWPTNYTKLASASMFTLFFGGDIFAPNARYRGETIQQFLQYHFVSCYQHLAR